MFVCSTVPDVHQATYMITLHSGTTQCIYQCGVQQVKKISPIFCLMVPNVHQATYMKTLCSGTTQYIYQC